MAHLRLELNGVLTIDPPYPEDATLLSAWLYDHCYVKSILAVSGTVIPKTDDDDLLPLLSAANQSHSGWDEGWSIEHSLSNGRILARKNGALRVFVAGEYISSRGPGCGPEQQGALLVFMPAASTSLQSSYYYAFGEAISRFEENTGVLRFYWNISADGSRHLIEQATRELNRFQVPFRIKCPNKRSKYPRRDAAVLYAHRYYYPIIARVLESLYDRLQPWLSSDTPLFTRELAPGLALAEDPGESFGQHRCRLLANAMVRSRTLSVPERLSSLNEEFENHGLSLERPWLNPGSSESYPFPFPD
ncbi:MAG: hypothetical protein JO033_06455 [Acidobacteriaceae bacterium]|nr:hypothetical protein [Acidobacteriaceae bacterium]MBV9502235.1 hypothetical protein [Acidobacteriaceae bacterium]